MKKIVALCLTLSVVSIFSGCVNQHPKTETNSREAQDTRIIATSVATVELAKKLDLDLVGIPKTKTFKIPERYQNATEVGAPMNPDMEVIKSLKPTDILSPKALEPDLKSRYEQTGLPYTFLDVSSVEGLYQSVELLGEKYGKQEIAKELLDDYHNTLDEIKKKREGKKEPKVLILMGLPGSYVIATDKSYVGNLVQMAGGKNIYPHEKEEFLNVNTEDLIQQDPDLIFCTVHAMPDEVIAQMKDEFATNDIWQHFRAVQEGRVYYLDYNLFHMSADFRWKDAIMSIEDELNLEK